MMRASKNPNGKNRLVQTNSPAFVPYHRNTYFVADRKIYDQISIYYSKSAPNETNDLPIIFIGVENEKFQKIIECQIFKVLLSLCIQMRRTPTFKSDLHLKLHHSAPVRAFLEEVF